MEKLKGTAIGIVVGSILIISLFALVASPEWMPAAGLALLAAWMKFSQAGQQSSSVAWMGISTLSQRLGSSSVVVIGIAGVVGVLVGLLAMAAGFGVKDLAGCV